MSNVAREIRAREFREIQVDFARLMGLEYPDEARQRSWARKNFHVICSQLYEQKFFPHQYFEYHDWMDFSQMELRKDLMSRYKLLDVLVSFPNLRTQGSRNVDLANEVLKANMLLSAFTAIRRREDIPRSATVAREDDRRIDLPARVLLTFGCATLLTYIIPTRSDALWSNLYLELWEPKKELTIRKRTDHPTPEWDRRSSNEVSSSRVEGWTRFAHVEEPSYNDRMRETWDADDEADTGRDNDWDLLKDWNVDGL